jgi:DMSO reductase anchor subunit
MEIVSRLNNWIVFQPYFIGIGAVITIFLLIVHRFSPILYLQHIQGIQKQILLQNIFLVILFFNYLSIILKLHLEVFELISFIFAIWVLKRWGTVFYQSKIAGWRHPTTHGAFFVHAILLGTALLNMLQPEDIDSDLLQIILVVLLGIDLLIVFARFQFLSKPGETTRKIARNLMGRNLLYFGARIILGIFMPAIFLIYNIIRGEGDVKGIEILVLLGILIDRYLFIDAADSFD